MSFPEIGKENPAPQTPQATIVTSSQFQAINGSELLDIICNHIKTELSQHDEFRPHLTYPKFMYSVKIEVDNYTASIPVLKEVKSPVIDVAGLEKRTFDKTVGTRKPVDVPDKARAEAGLPVSGQVVTEAGVFDVPKLNRLNLG